MKKAFIILLQILLLPLPWNLKRPLLNLSKGVKLASSAKIGFSIILAKEFIMEENSSITSLTFVNDIDKLHLKSYSKIGRSNWITGANTSATMFIDSERKCELVVGIHTRITSKHHIDCTGGVYIDDFTTVAGINTQILTHSVDMKLSKQMADPVYIGRYCFLGTSAILLKGTKLPDYCVLGAGAVLTKKYEQPLRVYAGNPAQPVKELNLDNYKYFTRNHGHVA